MFRIATDEWCAVCVKKMAAAGADPPRYAGGVDVAPIRSNAEPEPESYEFKLLNDCHCVLPFDDEGQLQQFAVDLVAGMKDGRCRVFKRDKSNLRKWLHENMDHPEWVAFLSGASDKWRKFPQSGATS